ncbi:unnamed protein product [Psylliodes chrysocephalus]|uniref:protein-histidine N-methyltransferase n=1 Tax=Psylliodes chrysocephalus TaxID=3402493 RepID=A0A9P0CHK6_9CUCU|nr:unnamed protein product [Psylliodes chrysocephala]
MFNWLFFIAYVRKMFKFDFLPDDESNNESETQLNKTTVVQAVPAMFLKSKEILPKNSQLVLQSVLKEAKIKVIQSNHVEIKYFCPNDVIDFLKSQDLDEESILKAEQNHSDLLPAIYEGGLKVWECTYDLLNYFKETPNDFKDKFVLDLGCGAGILGIYLLINGATCWFQDYNEDVINHITIPNVMLNSENFIARSNFFSGDWSSFVDLAEKKYSNFKFDYIITSETIYNTNYYTKLHLVFEKLLKSDGAVLLAAKSFYFGVGGGVHLFKDFIDSKKIFQYKNCWKSTEGVRREILKLYFL